MYYVSPFAGFSTTALKQGFETHAEFRREKAQEHPEDERNLKAAEIFALLAATSKDVQPILFEKYRLMFEVHDVRAVEIELQMLKEVGFHRWPKTATEFVSDFVHRCSEALQ
jgi:hypothetical protein